MNQVFEYKIPEKPRILVAPLDWGLGHTTRCIPVINALLAQNCQVLLAGNQRQEQVLRAEFPDLAFLPLKGYEIKYAKSGAGMLPSLLFQVPRILRSIKNERKWLKAIISEYNIDAVISDNRFGLYHTSVPCIFITHQLYIKTNLGKWSEKILQQINYRFINRFTACWVPDSEDPGSVGGELSHPLRLPAIPVKYIGLLSRFTKKNIPEKKNHLLILLSGPEPLRTQLEKKLVNEVSHYEGSATILRGLPGLPTFIPSTNMLHFYNHLPAAELADEMMQAEFVICRSGYSSLMDLVTLQKKSIIIPTPGQTEQEYLGNYLAKKKQAVCISQKKIRLQSALTIARKTEYQLPIVKEQQLLEKVITSFLTNHPNSDLG